MTNFAKKCKWESIKFPHIYKITWCIVNSVGHPGAKVKKKVIRDICNLDNFLFPELIKLMQQCSFGIMNRQKNVSIILEGFGNTSIYGLHLKMCLTRLSQMAYNVLDFHFTNASGILPSFIKAEGGPNQPFTGWLCLSICVEQSLFWHVTRLQSVNVMWAKTICVSRNNPVPCYFCSTSLANFNVLVHV